MGIFFSDRIDTQTGSRFKFRLHLKQIEKISSRGKIHKQIKIAVRRGDPFGARTEQAHPRGSEAPDYLFGQRVIPVTIPIEDYSVR
ncbi:hypothetical protein SAMN02745124_04245 [Desulfofustis glycolicus DSM 9705]|uniref:Uncharacterized protein n=1 Tax=Desulfofustis glycolicus DSM 9705 TaxID=1121409 RepID=A0A1M5YNA6_9BACT|nr:hypothetical protein SAMN02745124_04245 [Desulfofustis glycolicus DSM 9705]